MRSRSATRRRSAIEPVVYCPVVSRGYFSASVSSARIRRKVATPWTRKDATVAAHGCAFEN